MSAEEKRWAAVWTAWIAFFAVAEAVAIRSGNPQAPLSHHLRRGLGTSGTPLRRTAGQAVLGAGTVWLVSHLYERAVDAVSGTEVR